MSSRGKAVTDPGEAARLLARLFDEARGTAIVLRRRGGLDGQRHPRLPQRGRPLPPALQVLPRDVPLALLL